jgi:tRNA dimethylallyltransferase
LGAEIISADSRQIYKYLDIGTAKVEKKFRDEIKHHFIDIVEPDAYYSAGMFAREAREKIAALHQKKVPVIVAGGSGFYIKALIHGIVEQDVRDPEYREKLNAERAKYGVGFLYDQLNTIDPEYANKINRNDSQRIMRALEINKITGKNLAYWLKNEQNPADFTPLYIGLTMERQELYQRINSRVDRMLQQGLLDEVRSLLDKGYPKKINALNTVGYKEAIDYLEGKITKTQMAELIKRIVGFEGELFFNSEKPDGTLRKVTDVSRLHSLGWKHETKLEEGIQMLYNWYKAK